jgi:hypothetical protein
MVVKRDPDGRVLAVDQGEIVVERDVQARPCDRGRYGACDHRTEETEMAVTTDELEILEVGAAR